ncbi:MAG: HEPN domain-containing protein [bacterium]
MAEAGEWYGCVNRLYYACFYAVNALLLVHGLSSSKHSGVRSLFARNFVKSGQVPKTLGALYMELYEMRNKGDYQDLVKINPETIRPWIPEAEKFVAFVTALAKKTIEGEKE